MFAFQYIRLPANLARQLTDYVRAYAAMPPGPNRDTTVENYRIHLSTVLFDRFVPNRPPPAFGLNANNSTFGNQQHEGSRAITGDDASGRAWANDGQPTQENEDLVNPNWRASQTPAQVREVHEERKGSNISPARGVAPSSNLLWSPGSTITFFFQQPEYQTLEVTDPTRNARRKALFDAFREWASCSGFVFRMTDDPNANVRIFFHEGQGPYRGLSTNNESWTATGTKNLDLNRADKPSGGYPSTSMYLHLPQTSRSWGPDQVNGIFARRHCLHETGHLLGLRHEAANPRSLQKNYEFPSHSDYVPAFWTDWDPFSIMIHPGEENLPSTPWKARWTPYTSHLSPWDRAFATVRVILIKMNYTQYFTGLVFTRRGLCQIGPWIYWCSPRYSGSTGGKCQSIRCNALRNG